MNIFEKLGVNIDCIILGVLVVLLLLIIVSILQQNKLRKLTAKYNAFMEGSNGKTLESSIQNRFKEIDHLKEETKHLNEKAEQLTEKSLSAYQKSSIVKYDAFKEMGGKLSFSFCMLDDNNDGIIITSMHSTREGCYTYIKEIIKGESFVLLSEEEKQALKEAKDKNYYMA